MYFIKYLHVQTTVLTLIVANVSMLDEVWVLSFKSSPKRYLYCSIYLLCTLFHLNVTRWNSENIVRKTNTHDNGSLKLRKRDLKHCIYVRLLKSLLVLFSIKVHTEPHLQIFIESNLFIFNLYNNFIRFGKCYFLIMFCFQYSVGLKTCTFCIIVKCTYIAALIKH